MSDHDNEATALEFQDRLAGMTDDEVRAAYLASEEEFDDPWQDALANALAERRIDV